MKRFLLLLAVLLGSIGTFTSCCKNDETVEPETIVIDAGGTFYVQILATGEEITNTAEVIKGDSLLVVYKPKSENQNKSFLISCDGMEQKRDGVFVLKKEANGTFPVVFKAECSGETEIYRATKTLNLTIPSSYFLIPMIVSVSNDLLSFVDVDLCYTDKEGAEHQYRITEKDWFKYDSYTWYTYKDENGNVVESTNVPEGCEIISEETIDDTDSHFTLQTRFLNLQENVTTTFTAHYTPKADLVLNKDNYKFMHNIDRKSATISISGVTVVDMYLPINIDLTNHTVLKENVATYVENLSQTPDVKKFRISTDGHISSDN